jgi:hypothetical protein
MVVKALADYDAQDASELNLHENESVTVILKDESGWWQGRTLTLTLNLTLFLTLFLILILTPNPNP